MDGALESTLTCASMKSPDVSNCDISVGVKQETKFRNPRKR